MRIKKFETKYLDELYDIFFDSSSKKIFNSEIEKKQFSYKYLDYYYVNHADNFFVMVENEKVLGYICGALDSRRCHELYQLLPHFKIFDDLYDQFPIHLHMNTHSSARGKGIGTALLEHFSGHVKINFNKLHIITSPSAKNVEFYLKNGFIEIEVRSFINNELLLMGKTL